MAIATAVELVAQLRQFHLLEPRQLDELARKLQGKNLEPRALAKKLIELGWLTSYQVNQLLQGRGPDLVLGSYVLLDRLGEGGMGEVFKARHRKLGRVVAIKLIRKERLANEAAVKRFHREIRSASQLSHPNVVHAFDADQVGDTHLFVMECVDGVDLHQLVMESGPLAVAQACTCIRQAALGLQHAFEKGMVHRDVKPHNLMWVRSPGAPELRGEEGIVKVLDFGLARSAADTSSTLTQDGSLLGTLDYLAPEQASDSHAVDIRADLYSLGCTFYFLLTGQVPFPSVLAAQKLYKHGFEEAKPVEQIRQDVPPGVAAVVRKLIAKKAEDRFQTPAELAAVLAIGAANLAPLAPVIEGEREIPLALPMAAADTIAAGAAPPQEGRQRQRPVSRRRLLLGAVGAALAGLLLLFLGTFRLLTASAKPTKPAEPERFIENSIRMKLAYIPPGKFLMGSTTEELERFLKEPESRLPDSWYKDEGPRHEVRITQGFYMGVHEVKQSEYAKVMGKNPSGFKDSPDHPVEQVNWDEAVDFCKKLSDLPDEKKAGRVSRLPTGAEWEYACRAGTTTVFHHGNALSSKQANFKADAPFGGAEKGPDVGKTLKVDSHPGNAWGLCNMHGNVWEWCLDGPRTYQRGVQAIDDPRGEVAGDARVLRGGSWLHGAWFCRSALRAPQRSSFRANDIGFRVVVR